MFYKEKADVAKIVPSYKYNDYLTKGENLPLYYKKCVEVALDLCDKLTNSFGYLEMEIPNYLSNDELNNLYWNSFNITYFNESYKISSDIYYTETFPLAKF